MYRLSGAIVALVLLMGSAAHGQAQTQGPATPIATPSPTPQPPPPGTPSGNQLISKARKAEARFNTVHEVSTTTSEIPGVMREVDSITVDQRDKPYAARQTETLQRVDLGVSPSVTTTTHRESISTKTRIATRDPGGAWSCLKVMSEKGGINVPAPPVSTGQVDTRTLGAESVRGILVWHVRITAQIGSDAEVHVLTDLYIARKDYRFVRIHVQDELPSPDGSGTLQIVSTSNYSRYGEKINVTLPKACRGK